MGCFVCIFFWIFFFWMFIFYFEYSIFAGKFQKQATKLLNALSRGQKFILFCILWFYSVWGRKTLSLIWSIKCQWTVQDGRNPGLYSGNIIIIIKKLLSVYKQWSFTYLDPTLISGLFTYPETCLETNYCYINYIKCDSLIKYSVILTVSLELEVSE